MPKIGYKCTNEHKRKVSDAIKKQWLNGKRKGGWKLSDGAKKKISIAHMGHKSYFPIGYSVWNKGKKNAQPKLYGSDNPHWKGGITIKNTQLRNSYQYRDWRRSVYIRDNFTCVFCEITGGRLVAHHVKEFSLYPKLRFDISNGITLCVECHKFIHKKHDK
jgi:hypothetical protein